MPPPSHRPDIAPPRQITPIAAQGFAVGALRFGCISLFSHVLLSRFHPTYRRLTPQFKTFLQVSAMTLGGIIFAEKRVSEFNDAIRRRNRALERSRRAWSEREALIEGMMRREEGNGDGDRGG